MDGKQALDFGASSGFPSLLRLQGLLAPAAQIGPMNARGEIVPTESTTILAFKFSDGVLVAGDRRATSGNTVVYDRADKVLEIDQRSIMAIAGVPATAWEMARVLEHSFQFFRRTQLQEMSVDGKVRALSKLLRDNFGFALQGVGIVVPIFATYDVKASPSWRLMEFARCRKKRSRNYFRNASHDRRAVSLGGSNCHASRLHRDAAGHRQSSGRAWL